jgi:hypothetical protein
VILFIMAKKKSVFDIIFNAASEDKPKREKPKYHCKVGRPRMYETPEEMQIEIDKYFEQIDEANPPTLTGLALFLGYMDRHSLYEGEKRPEFSNTIKRARARLNAFAEQQLMARDKPTGAIFWLKNSGWSDKREVEHSGSIDIKNLSPEEEEKRIDELIAKRDK